MIKDLSIDEIILRTPRITDLHAFNYYAKKPNIGPNAGWKPHESLKESEQFLKMFIIQKNVWAITLKDCDIMIGSISLNNQEFNFVEGNGIEIGYVLDDTYWQKGYMTKILGRVIKYLFEETDINYISIYHYEDNIGSKRVIEKNNFKYIDEILKIDSFDILRVSLKYKLLKEEYKP